MLSIVPYWPISFAAVFFANARHARNIVGGIAHQAEQINHLRGTLNPPLRHHFFGAEHFRDIAHPGRFVDKSLFRDQLPEILVRRHHVRGEPLRLGRPHQRADDVVSLATVAFQDRDIESLQQTAHMRERGAEILGHCLPLRFILRILGMAMGGSIRIESDPHMRRLLVIEQFQERLREAVKRRCVHPLRSENGTGDQRKMSPVNQRHRIQ